MFVGFFGVVLELARPSEPWCFAAGSCFFRSYCTGISSSSRHLRAAAGDRFSRKKLFFQDFRRHVRQFFSVVLKLARPLEPWFFAAGSCRQVLFSKLVSCKQLQATESLDKCCFSIGFQTTRLGSFFAWFWTLLVLQSHGVLLPGAAFFEAVLPASAAAAAATSSASSRRQQNLSNKAVCLEFLAWFWN